MIQKSIIIGTFVKKTKVCSFLETLKHKYHIQIDKVFVYLLTSNDYEYLVTFKAYSKEPYLKEIPNASVMHVKNGCLFSINALNKLIENESGLQSKDYVIDWTKYKDQLIILTKGQLSISPITKVEDKKTLFF